MRLATPLWVPVSKRSCCVVAGVDWALPNLSASPALHTCIVGQTSQEAQHMLSHHITDRVAIYRVLFEKLGAG